VFDRKNAESRHKAFWLISTFDFGCGEEGLGGLSDASVHDGSDREGLIVLMVMRRGG
jgi:hypothetical protein